MAENWDRDAFIRELEERGENGVWFDMQTGVHGGTDGERYRIAHDWYFDRVNERQDAQDRLREASQAEQAAIAASAKDAAWAAAEATREQARTARQALTMARIAAMTAALALIVSIVTLYLDKGEKPAGGGTTPVSQSSPRR